MPANDSDLRPFKTRAVTRLEAEGQRVLEAGSRVVEVAHCLGKETQRAVYAHEMVGLLPLPTWTTQSTDPTYHSSRETKLL